jgi:thioredoxin-related protein
MRQLLILLVVFLITGFTTPAKDHNGHETTQKSQKIQSSKLTPGADAPITLAKAMQLASMNHKKVLIDFMADWCIYCKKMDKEVFPNPKVHAVLSEYFYKVKINVESKDQVTFQGKTYTKAQFAQAFGVSGLPTYVFMDSKGNFIAGQPGYIPAPDFARMLSYIGSDAYKKMSFKDYSSSSGR